MNAGWRNVVALLAFLLASSVAAWLVWRSAGSLRIARRELALWGIQLTLNAH